MNSDEAAREPVEASFAEPVDLPVIDAPVIEPPAVDALPDEPAGRGGVDGRWLIALAALLWSTSGLFAKGAIFDDWPRETRGTLLAFWRALFAGVLILPALRRPHFTPRLLPMAFSFAAMNATYLTAMTQTTAANAIWLQNTGPWWVCLLGAWLFREPFSKADLTPLVFAGLGVAVILYHEAAGKDQFGIVCGLAAGLAYALVVLQMRAMHEADPVWLVVVNHLITAAILLPFVIRIGVWPSGAQLLVLAAFGLVQMALPYVLFARGLKTVSSQEATGIALLEPLLLPVWVYLAWGEEPAWWTWLGGSLILVGLTIRYLRPLLNRQRRSGIA